MFYSKKLNKFKRIKHCFFSKKGGVSKGLYKSLNCGRGSKDNKKDVLKNLNLISKKMGVKKNKLILMNQTHSAKVVEIKKDNIKKILILML
jgi:copper oxidase (laccase) domain-containing protein